MTRRPQSDQTTSERQRLAQQLVSDLPPDALPDGFSSEDRALLIEALASGELEDVYRPMGATFINVTFPDTPPWVDPRMRLSAWLMLRRAGLSAETIRDGVASGCLTGQEAR